MLKFLARDKSNLEKIQKLKRNSSVPSTQASINRIEVARSFISSAKPLAIAPLVKHAGLFDRLEVRAVVDRLVQEVEEKFEVNSVVKFTMNRILRK